VTPSRAVGLVAAAILLAGCQRVAAPPPAPPGPQPSLAACAPVDPDVRSWDVVRDSAGVSFRMPLGLAPRSRDDLPFREWTTEGSPSGRVSIGFSPSREHWLSIRRVPSPGMAEMSECVDSLEDRQILLQAWRMVGGRFSQGRRSDLYEVLALVPVEPMLTLYVTGGGEDPRFQELVLRIARSVRVEREVADLEPGRAPDAPLPGGSG